MNEQIRVILEKADRSLEAAKLLAAQGYLDFAAARAYYAMFYVAEALLLERDLSFSSHAAVIANFGKEFSKTREFDPKFHKFLIAAQDFRSQGDYGFGPGVSEDHVNNVLDWASEFLEVAKAYLHLSATGD
jgi:uncharacterized protein (UPF0332 family)